MTSASLFSRVVRFGAFEFDPVALELRKQGMKIRLQGQPVDILALLLERPGEIVTREELQKKLWPADTFVDFEHSLNAAVKRLRDALDDSADTPRYVETLPRRGYRYIGPMANRVSTNSRRMYWGKLVLPVVAGVILAAGGYFYSHRKPELTDIDTIILADFTNTTGDAVFDGTLRQGLSIQLEQSPFLSLISDEQIQQTLKMMDQKSDTRLTLEIARQICQRTASAVVVDGSIASLGGQYVLGLKAVNCRTGDSLAQEQATANNKEQVLKALGEAAAKLREKLGESLITVQKYDTPLKEATTSSLEALQAFSLGWQGLVGVGPAGSSDPVPLFKRAIKLDPNFAKAYWALGMAYSNGGENGLAAENMRKAYDLREHVSERERLFIEADYPSLVNGDLEKAKTAFEALAQTYPRDCGPRNLLGAIYDTYGQYDKALMEYREAFRLCPGPELISNNIINMYRSLNRLEEARATAEQRLAKEIDSSTSHYFLYQIAFLQNDEAGIKQQIAWEASKPNEGDTALKMEADTAFYAGHLAKARSFSRRAIDLAERAEAKEGAASTVAFESLREAFFGNTVTARQGAVAALALSTGRDVQFLAALALALAGEAARAHQLTDDLGKRFPEDTVVHFEYLPTLQAQLALDRKEYSKATELLERVAPYELAVLEAIYVRGNAYLGAHQGKEAAVEFQKIIDHPGIVVTDPLGVLAHLGVARAYVLHGDTVKARAAYQDFLTLWKDADPEIPILKQAKAEYAKLK